MTTKAIPIRLESELLGRVDRLAEALQERAAGAPVTRSGAMRVAMERGLDALEAELGLAGRRAKKK